MRANGRILEGDGSATPTPSERTAFHRAVRAALAAGHRIGPELRFRRARLPRGQTSYDSPDPGAARQAAAHRTKVLPRPGAALRWSPRNGRHRTVRLVFQRRQTRLQGDGRSHAALGTFTGAPAGRPAAFRAGQDPRPGAPPPAGERTAALVFRGSADRDIRRRRQGSGLQPLLHRRLVHGGHLPCGGRIRSRTRLRKPALRTPAAFAAQGRRPVGLRRLPGGAWGPNSSRRTSSPSRRAVAGWPT
ncbi:MAG: hypothetical protein RJA37_1732 [Verrucomicrobiota bacterium]